MNMNIGYNLAGVSYWTAEPPQNNVALCIGTDGADNILKLMVPASGNYTAQFTGTGTVTIGAYALTAGAAPITIALVAGVTYTVTINGTIASLNILPVGVAAGWSSAFLAALKGANASVFRTMQWQRMNGSAETTWASRVQPTAWNWTSGVPHEAIISLANASGLDPWICIPALATADYIAGCASLYAATLNAGLHVYVEYSNETWNGGFAQYQQVQAAAAANKKITATDVGSRTACQAAEMCYQIGTAFQTAFPAAGKSMQQVRPVYASQIGNNWLQQTGFAYLAKQYPGWLPYMLATAPYISDQGEVGPAGTAVATIIADYQYTGNSNGSGSGLPYGIGWPLASAKVDAATAKSVGVAYGCYEAGTQCKYQNDANRMAAQTNAAMGPLYANYLGTLAATGAVLVNHYEFVSGDSYAAFSSLAAAANPTLATDPKGYELASAAPVTPPRNRAHHYAPAG